MSIAIQVQDLSKAYQIGQIGTGTISRDLERWWTATVRGKEDPFLKIGETNDRSTKGESDIVWSLKDINFEIQQGDAVGIIGRNGAGKSTLLKLMSEVTSPTTGKINIKGRVASLLEVGTGFHPELTGRENIFLNGAILGMRKNEIQRKLEQIIDFSGVERYIDTPVKRYSSGMYVRLAFAVAAHLESEILIVDEVLAVGDAEFQKKCLGKMGDISKGEGRTVLFVSHNLGSINALCTKCILLKNGMLEKYGGTNEVINEYYSIEKDGGVFNIGLGSKNEKIIISKIELYNDDNCGTDKFEFGEAIKIEIEIEALTDIYKPFIWILVKDSKNDLFAATGMLDGFVPKLFKKGINRFACRFNKLPLLPGTYFIHLGIRANDGLTLLTDSKDVAIFNIISKLSDIGFNGSMADIISDNWFQPLVEYTWDFDDNKEYKYKIANYVK